MDKFDLIIFDCDGVLVDSERITNTVFAEMLNELGIPATLETMFDEFVGNSMARCVEMIEEKLEAKVPDNFDKIYRERCKGALEKSLIPVDGIQETILEIKIPMCVASSGDHEKMNMTLGITGLLPTFEGRLFSVTEVERGKPYPDVFLHAAKNMGFEPEKCAVIEDTEIGATAGIAAGMTVFGYSKYTKKERFLKIGAIPFSDMRELPFLIRGNG
jgi:HAD superfamily hydrolase (TIGR01509 family)